MKTILGLLLLAFSGSAHAATYEFVPNGETSQMCQKLGMTGQFRLQAFSGKSWKMVFATGQYRILDKISRGVYRSYISCAVGCSGYAETKLNMNTGKYSHWNSIDRAPQKCNGAVVVR